MAINLDLISGSNFVSTIKSYCNSLGWSIYDINNKRAILNFDADSGNTQTLFIIKHENTLEFSVPSGIKYDETGDIPGWLSTALLTQNSQFKVGFWCIEEIGEKHTFSIMHNAELSLINVNYFRLVSLALVKRCDELEQTVARALGGY
ncbi:hypothetical protein [Calothrix sp. NIES-3974]|uniref:hypothetical protein n=1 Tax=Calothrix sp. NIES-3974 TaxID=2005462 RepID=UPI000B5EB1BD|nr:hypothetical protein [Calothrix sp. NIES-3974]BAZ04174.1 hypothetical protein NIES3974_08060 [Calothrix sp. NIES-3974]